MQLKAFIDYGLRIVIYLAMAGGICSSHDIAKNTGASRNYLLQIAQTLRNAGIIQAHAGKKGGYSLAKDPSDITLMDIIGALDNSFNTTEEDERAAIDASDDLPIAKNIRKTLNSIAFSHDAYLAGLTLQTMVEISADYENIDTYLSEGLAAESARLSAKRAGSKENRPMIRALSIGNVQSKSPAANMDSVSIQEILFLEERENEDVEGE